LNREKKDSRHREKGVALVTVLMAMLGLTIIGTTAFIMSGADLTIISRYRDSQQALYAAEAGVQTLLAGFRGNPGLFLLKKTGSEISLPLSEPAQGNWKHFRLWVESLRYDPGAVPEFVELIVQAIDPLNQTSARLKATILAVFSGGAGEVAPPFRFGLLTAGSLQVGGTPPWQTHIHANQGFVLDPALVDGLRQQQFTVSQSADPRQSDYREPWEVPALRSVDFEQLRVQAQGKGNRYFVGPQTLKLTGDQQGTLFFVEGDVTLQGEDLSGITLVSTGKITFRGTSRLNGDQKMDVAFLAGGDLLLEAVPEAAGVFWSGGAFIPPAGGSLEGIVVSRGSIHSSGTFTFRRCERIANPYLPHPPLKGEFTLKGWLQL
jgi:hypothetical protein